MVPPACDVASNTSTGADGSNTVHMSERRPRALVLEKEPRRVCPLLSLRDNARTSVEGWREGRELLVGASKSTARRAPALMPPPLPTSRIGS